MKARSAAQRGGFCAAGAERNGDRMKTYKTSFWSRNVPKAIQTGKYPLTTETASEIRMEDGILEIVLKAKCKAPDQCWLFLYDKKDGRYKGDFLEAAEQTGRTFRFRLTDRFLDSLRGADDIWQGRLCLALRWGREFSCFFLKQKGSGGQRLGLQGNLAVYFSKGSLLSAKFVDVERYLKTAKIREKDGRMLQMAFDDFLMGDQAVSEGIYDAQLKSEREGLLSVSLSALGETAIQSCYLLLLENGESLRRLLLAGTVEQDRVCFDVSQIGADALWSDNVWFCFVAFDLGDCYVYSRVREKSNIDWQKTTKAEGLFPASCLWQDSGRYFGVAARLQREDGAYQLLFAPSDVKNTLTLKWHSAKQAELLLNGQVWHHGGAGRVKRYPFAFSVVMAVYNVEDYLDETIESVLNQDIGFRENVQLILVDDGSSDGSGAICDRYAAQYPDNIVAIHQQNGGASSARNAGKKLATGKYVNFLDSDDKLSLNTFSEVKEHFDRWYDRTDIVTIPMYFFEAQEGPHWQNYKFNEGSRVIDLWKEPTASCMSVSSSFFKNNAVQKFDFDVSLFNAEDCKFDMQILMGRMNLGVVVECDYWYRRRSAGDSQVNTSASRKGYYKEWFDNFAFYIFEIYKRKFGCVPRFAQNTIMMYLQWRFRIEQIPEGVLLPSEFEDYKKRIIKLLQCIDDELILKQHKLNIEHLVQILSMKYGAPPTIRYRYNDAGIYCGERLIRAANTLVTRFEFIRVQEETLVLEGRVVLVGFPDEAKVDIYAAIGDNYYLCRRVDRKLKTSNCFGNLRNEYAFCGKVPLVSENMDKTLHMAMVIDGHLIVNRKCNYGKFCPVANNFKNQYYYVNDSVVIFGRRDGIELKTPELTRDEYEALFAQELAEQCETAASPKEFSQPIFSSTMTQEKYEEIIRLRQYALTTEKKRPIWLISDRLTIADDNGTALFRYLMKQKDLPADVYFVIKKNCPDYEKMAAIGPVLAFGSEEHLKLHLIADLTIGSQSSEFVITPFCKDTVYYGDRAYYCDLLVGQKYVFLQHGITMNDVSNVLNRYHKNIAGFVVSATKERQSILEYPYYYDDETVWLTGFPRFDRLYENSKNQITIMPTWRNFLRGSVREKFVQSEFYQFYRDLVTDPALNGILQKKGYTLCIKLHPELLVYGDLFEMLGVTIIDPEEPYRKMYAESNLIITDYSSASLDFSYMRKPVVYCQFDETAFFSKHYQRGYFSYRDDGFGPVTTTVEETVQEIIKLVENDCRMEQKYLDRCNAFFPINDYNNCERVYQKLKEL
ncbi:MAG: bifunctional glycosyltransferase family 2 protein/CDP-glycerol:glycerophosphate glycerophosphotransferase [Clostridiales bacterium]|nr:bifunctional glycosyltransferase family 2 protein/CDP-glycerol:glycerophosphate glycerophosphotransferase [Clostridiales bacterium]